MADRPIRVQLSRAKGWRMPENTVKVDRTTKWGNPYPVKSAKRTHPKEAGMTPAQAVAAYREQMADLIEENGTLWLIPLAGKNLACWCAPDAPCHADVLLELANDEAPD